MRAFEYAQPKTKPQAIELLASSWGETEILAGGTDLLGLMKGDLAAPKRVVDIKGIPELAGIRFAATTGLRAGALATLQELADSPEVRKHYAALAMAAAGVGSPQVRNRATIGGDLCQRPRCWYYRNGHGLLGLDEKDQPLVPGGDNRYHAILGNAGPAYFISPSSLGVALVALGGSVRLLGPKGERDVAAADFFRAPKGPHEREHDLAANEIVIEVRIPPPAGAQSAMYEVREHTGVDWPLASAAVALTLEGTSVRAARIALGHVAPTPWRAAAAEAALKGKPVNAETAAAAGAAAVETAKSLGDNGYKIQLARVAVKRALLMAARGGGK